MELFTDVVVFDGTAVGLARSEGSDALGSYFAQLFNVVEGMRHLTSNHVLDDLAGDQALGSCSAIAIALTGGSRLEVTCRYEDDYVRTKDCWKFSSRISISSLPMDVSSVRRDAP